MAFADGPVGDSGMGRRTVRWYGAAALKRNDRWRRELADSGEHALRDVGDSAGHMSRLFRDRSAHSDVVHAIDPEMVASAVLSKTSRIPARRLSVESIADASDPHRGSGDISRLKSFPGR